MSESADAAEPLGILGAFDELLKRPQAALARADRAASGLTRWRLLGGAAVCWVCYGAAAGFFQGGSQVVVASLKAGLVVAASLALCVPSLYVLAALTGADLSPRRFLALIAGFAGMLGLLLVALVPIGWLFSLSSNRLGFVVWIHIALWLFALFFAGRFLADALRHAGSRAIAGMWVALFCVVSFQVTTMLRPVLSRPVGAPLFDGNRKMFFLEHFARIVNEPVAAASGKR